MKKAIGMRTVVVMAGIALALVCLYMFLYIPEALRLSRLRDEHSALSEELAAARQKISLRPDVDRAIERVKGDIAELEATTIRGDEISLAIETFEAEAYKLGMGKGVLIRVIDPENGGSAGSGEKKSPSDAVRSLRFSIVMRCAYRELLEYVSSLGKLSMLVTVDDVTVQKVEEVEEGLYAELEVSTYSLR